jgi:methionine aminopeptidase
MEKEIKAIREAVADYMESEGCDCWEDYENHKIHKKILAKLLKVPMYKDKSGYDFSKFRSK